MLPLVIDFNALMLGICGFLRITALLFTMPFFGDRTVPVQVRILLAVALTLCFLPHIPAIQVGQLVNEPIYLGMIVFKEVGLGIAIGLVTHFIFDGIVMAASIVGYQMGFGTANMILPGSDAQMNSFTALHRLFVVLIFFSLSFHQLFLEAIYASFTQIPIGKLTLNGEWIHFLIQSSANIFIIGLKLAAPILVALMFTMAALGLIAKTVPQMNVFTISFPISFFVGLVTYLALFPFFPDWMKNYYLQQGQDIIETLSLLGS